MTTLKALIQDENGQSMVEYGIIVAVIAAICIGAYRQIGTTINTKLDTLIKNMK
ncbi:MAG: Flp family type IVb pilin [Candidatus Sericytochromatia bacterium]|nr:Flp family type IVb pilin [Candidatus Tanganyikabacteria bacterium]